jgi:hypothetical protein
MITAKIDVSAKWSQEFAARVNAAAPKALAEAADVGAAKASSIARERSRTGQMGHVAAVKVKPTDNGWVGGFLSEAGKAGEFYSGFQSRGTIGARRRAVKGSTLSRRESPSGKARYAKVAGKKGITPLRHEEDGLMTAKRFLVMRLNSML